MKFSCWKMTTKVTWLFLDAKQIYLFVQCEKILADGTFEYHCIKIFKQQFTIHSEKTVIIYLCYSACYQIKEKQHMKTYSTLLNAKNLLFLISKLELMKNAIRKNFENNLHCWLQISSETKLVQKNTKLLQGNNKCV